MRHGNTYIHAHIQTWIRNCIYAYRLKHVRTLECIFGYLNQHGMAWHGNHQSYGQTRVCIPAWIGLVTLEHTQYTYNTCTTHIHTYAHQHDKVRLWHHLLAPFIHTHLCICACIYIYKCVSFVHHIHPICVCICAYTSITSVVVCIWNRACRIWCWPHTTRIHCMYTCIHNFNSRCVAVHTGNIRILTGDSSSFKRLSSLSVVIRSYRKGARVE